IVSSINQNSTTKSKIVSSTKLRADTEYEAAQRRYLGLNGSETATQGYTSINLSLNTHIKYSGNNGLQLQLGVNNLFDVVYQSHLSRLKYFEYYNQSGGRSGIYNMGRNISVKIIAAF